MSVAPSSPPAPLAARVPTAFFGAVLGLGGLANGWRVASRLYGLPSQIGDALALVALAVWAAVLGLIVAKWLVARPAARGELLHPVTGGFVGLLPVATMIAGIAALPLIGVVAQAMLVVGVAAQIVFAVWFVGRLWSGGRGAEATTPVLYLPTVGGSFVAAMALAALGARDAAVMAFGAGLLSWVVLEAVMWQRLLHLPSLPIPLRATMGIHMAPPAVGLVAYLAATGAGADTVGLMLLGYALLQAAITARMMPWLGELPFAAPWWAYSFAISALPTGAMRLAEAGAGPTVALLAPILFVAANGIIAGFAVGSARLILAGKYLPPLPIAPPPAAAAEAPPAPTATP